MEHPVNNPVGSADCSVLCFFVQAAVAVVKEHREVRDFVQLDAGGRHRVNGPVNMKIVSVSFFRRLKNRWCGESEPGRSSK